MKQKTLIIFLVLIAAIGIGIWAWTKHKKPSLATTRANNGAAFPEDTSAPSGVKAPGAAPSGVKGSGGDDVMAKMRRVV
jgi:hypothetical protein